MYKQRSYLVNTSDTMLQKAAVGTKEEIRLQQLLSLTLSCSGPHNTVLIYFVSLDTLNMPVSLLTRWHATAEAVRESLDPSRVISYQHPVHTLSARLNSFLLIQHQGGIATAGVLRHFVRNCWNHCKIHPDRTSICCIKCSVSLQH